MKSEHGAEVARDMVEGLVIMRGAEAQRPCYWTCPACSHSKFDSAKGFLDHVEQMHEEVQMLDASTPVSCHQCHHEVLSRSVFNGASASALLAFGGTLNLRGKLFHCALESPCA